MRSTSGYYVFIRRNLVSWKSKKKNVVSRSSAESEYRAMSQSVCDIMWFHQLLMEVGIKTPNSGVITRLPFILLLILFSMNELTILR